MTYDPPAEQVREQISDPPGAVVRRRRRTGRRRQVLARFSDDEWRDVCAAAHSAGFTPSGWTAATGVAAARRRPPPRLAVAEATLRELAATRKQLVRVGTLLNQSVKATNASGTVAPGLPHLAGRVEVLIAELDRRTAALLSRGRL
jgi:hypothetical protein